MRVDFVYRAMAVINISTPCHSGKSEISTVHALESIAPTCYKQKQHELEAQIEPLDYHGMTYMGFHINELVLNLTE